MNIAVITFSDMNTNYGSILQAYSMKIQLNKMGHEVVFIRYREFIHFPKETIKQELRKKLLALYKKLHTKNATLKKYNFDDFISHNLCHTPLFTSCEEIIEKLPEFHAYICGSDQIWNVPSLRGIRSPYFLAFVPTNKLKAAYAPSIGGYKIDDENREEFSKLLNHLDYISCREKCSIELLKALTNKPIIHVVDPVLLSSVEEWQNFAKNEVAPQNAYGVCYFVQRSSFARKLTRTLKKLYKFPIYNLSDVLIHVTGTSRKYISCGPRKFVKMIANAQFCIGTSFHLTVFSIIFNRPFLIAGTNHNKDRVGDILKAAGYEDRLVYQNENWKIKLKQIHKTIVQMDDLNKLNNLINESKKYLETIVSAAAQNE